MTRCVVTSAAFALHLLCAVGARGFEHPGVSLNQAELDRIRDEVNAQVEPRMSGWNEMLSHHTSSLAYVPNPQDTVLADGGTSGGFSDDVLAARSHA
ncbi:MAG: hypothetical protein GF331_18025, partial [Chitinivibrionales bacterium]|nr:hypothetical protein [Chitinivibrionales bacterium]